MNVWIKETRKRVLCRHCNQFIEAGEYQVVCTYFMKLKHSETTWTKAMHFHAKEPYCWIEQGIIQIGLRPRSENRGRRPDNISDNNKLMRQKILRRRASVMQRINCEMDGEMRPDKLIHLTDLLDKLAIEIEPLGGVPASWR